MRTLFFALCLAGCATTQQQPAAMKGADSAGDVMTDENTEPLTGNPPHKRKGDESRAPGVIPRAALAEVLAESPGYFLQHVQTEPRFDHGRFAGWRLVSFFPGDARFAGVDLQAGDVVMRVNGHAIEQPDQFMAVWTELKSSHELTVDVERAGTPRTLRWTIADK